MGLKGWILTALAALAVYAGGFIHGKFQERSVNAPAIARAQAKYDALEGENKKLVTEAESFEVKEGVWALKLQDSERKRKAMVKNTTTTTQLLGTDSGGRPILGKKVETHVSVKEDVQSRRRAAVRARSTSRTRTVKKSSLQANRQQTPWKSAGFDWTPDNWTTTQGLVTGEAGAKLGLKFGPHLEVYGKDQFLRVEDGQVSWLPFKPGVGAAWNW